LIDLFLGFKGTPMHRRKVFCCQVGMGLAVLIPLVSGCRQGVPYREQPSAEARVQKLAALCSAYAVQQKRKPASIDELKAWAKKLDKTEQARLGIEDPENAFVSPRDNEPYVLVKSAGSGPGDVLAYERTGAGGKHYIVTPMGSAFELDKAELKRRVPSAK
jgi:hypothetical protein